jgi:hypothetical protein
MRLFPVAVAVCLTVLASSAPAAAPVLDVRARLRIDITRAGRLGESVVIQGTVKDDAGVPLADRLVRLRLVDPERPTAPPLAVVARTAETGRFEVQRPVGALPETRWRLVADVEGDPHYAAPPPVERTIDLRRRAVTLTVGAPASITLATRAIRLQVTLGDDASADDELAPRAPVSLFVGGGRVAEVTLDATGRGEVTASLPAGLREGERLAVEARYPGDSMRAPAEGRAEVRVTATTRLSLELTGDELPRDARVTATALLLDERGPIAGEPVSLVEASANGELDDAAPPLAVGVTGPDGRARLELVGRRLALGAHFVEARYQPTTQARAPSRSGLVALTIVAPRGRALLSYGIPLALVVGVLAARFVRDRRARAAGEEPRRRRATRREHDAALSGGGTLVEGRPTLLAALRAANDVGVAGRVEDARTGAPLAGARVVVVDATGARRELEADRDGRFAVEGLAPGPLALTVDARAFVPEEIARELPHRGELRGLVVRLVPIKERVFAAWRALALPLLPNPAQAATLTPRELLAIARRRFLLVGDDGALASLTALVEEACFGPRAPDLAMLAEAERRCASARSELAPASS